MAATNEVEPKKLEDRVHSLELTRQVVIAVAVFFGVSGAYLGAKLSEAYENIKKLSAEVDKQQDKLAEARDRAIAAVQAEAKEALVIGLGDFEVGVKLGEKKGTFPDSPRGGDKDYYAVRDTHNRCPDGYVMTAVRGGAVPGETGGECRPIEVMLRRR